MSLPNTANAVAAGSLFPSVLVPELMNLVKGHSSIAAMSAQKPLAFNGNTLFTFNFDNEIDVVAEAGAKSAGGATVASKTITPIKVEYGTRVSDEFLTASEEEKMDILRAFSDGFAKKLARGLDIMALYGVNPRTGSAASGTIGNNYIDYVVSNSVTYLADSSTADENIASAIALVEAGDYDVDGLIGGKTIKAALAAQTMGSDDLPVYPELKWGGKPNELNGLPVDFNGTVEYNSGLLRAVVGDWDMFRWGIAKEIPMTVIPYGNPDNDGTAGDLAGHNQVYLRAEAFIGWAILDGSAFAKVKAAST